MHFMARVIPDVHKVETVEASRLVVHVRPNFSFFSGTVKLFFEVIREDVDSLAITVQARGIGGGVAVEINIQMAQSGAGTTLHWQGDITRKEGLFRPIGDTLIEGAAGRIVEHLWDGFRESLADPRTSDRGC